MPVGWMLAAADPSYLSEPVEPGGVESPKSLELGGLQSGVGPDVVVQEFHDPRIARRQKTDGPVRTEHQPSDSEGLEHHIEEGDEVVLLPVLVIRLGDHPRDLA